MEGHLVTAKGPLGELSYELLPGIEVDSRRRTRSCVLNQIVHRGAAGRSLHGVSRAMVANLVEGVTKGFPRAWRSSAPGGARPWPGRPSRSAWATPNRSRSRSRTGSRRRWRTSRPRITIKGIRKDQVGQFAADIRALRPPEPYLGKGIKYDKEEIRKKAGQVRRLIAERGTAEP